MLKLMGKKIFTIFYAQKFCSCKPMSKYDNLIEMKIESCQWIFKKKSINPKTQDKKVFRSTDFLLLPINKRKSVDLYNILRPELI